ADLGRAARNHLLLRVFLAGPADRGPCRGAPALAGQHRALGAQRPHRSSAGSGRMRARVVRGAFLAFGLALSAIGAFAQPSTDARPPKQVSFSFEGPFGTYDRAALQRGFQVYKEVCAACHAVKHLAFRDLAEIGYSEDQVKGIAAQVQVTDGPNDSGEMFQRPGRPSDPIPGPLD